MKWVTRVSFVVYLGVGVALLTLAFFGWNGLTLTVALSCIVGSIGIAEALASWRRRNAASDYELNLLARLDSRDPAVHHQAENERELQDWQKSHQSVTGSR